MGIYEEVVESRVKALLELSRLTGEYQAAKAVIDADIRDCDQILAVAERASDMVDLFLTARNVVQIQWDEFGGGRYKHTGAKEMQECVDAAVEDLRQGAPRMRKQYFGIKQYDRWDAQRSDHEYGYGPKHGSIWFRIGLTNRARVIGLSEQERIAAVAWVKAVWDDPLLLG